MPHLQETRAGDRSMPDRDRAGGLEINQDLDFQRRTWTVQRVDQWLDGVPTVLVEAARPLKDLRDRARVDEEDVLAAARERQGLARMDQIKYAVLERSGGISIIPKEHNP